MSPKYQHLEIGLIYFLLLIPWPYTNVIKMLCSRDNSRLVRKIVRSKWTPILDKHQVKLPLECPLHPFRDLFAPRQDAKKRDRPTQWTCRLCGKSFYQEKFLDLHFETRHKTIINEAEDSVCLADFCDLLRCEVFQTEESSSLKIGDQHIITDIEVWGDSWGQQNSALAKANAAYLSLIPLRTSTLGATSAAKIQNRQLIPERSKHNSELAHTESEKQQTVNARNKLMNESLLKRLKDGVVSGSKTAAAAAAAAAVAATQTHKSVASGEEAKQSNKTDAKTAQQQEEQQAQDNETSQTNSNLNNNNNNSSSSSNMTNGMQKLRANCKSEDLSKLKARCELLVRNCIGGLLLSMSDQSFKEMEEEMNKAVCWYLTCDRYWEDGPLEPRAFPWGLIIILIFVLSTGICFCYYIIWILFDTEETTTTIYANHFGSGYMTTYPTYGSDYLMSGDISIATQQQQQQQYYYQQQQQQQQRDLYAEQIKYDYHRHSPRHYIGEQQRPPIVLPAGQLTPPTAAANVLQHTSNTNTPLHRQHQANLAYQHQQDILDRRDYMNNRAMAATAVSSSRMGPNANAGLTITPTTIINEANSNAAAGAAAALGNRHYNTHPRPLETRHRNAGASQQSLRASTSTHEIIQNEVGQNEHYIYVTYPPDLKKRYYDKYE